MKEEIIESRDVLWARLNNAIQEQLRFLLGNNIIQAYLQAELIRHYSAILQNTEK